MSGGFTDDERERIREQLVSEGRELFARYGLKKTTIADLTDPVGIANGTFYQFFDSKVDLYLEILEREGEEILPRVVRPMQTAEDAETGIREVLTALMDEIESNELVRRLIYNRDEMAQFRDHFTEEELARERENDVQFFLPHVREWYEAGEIEGPDPETVAHAIRAVSMLSLHIDDIGEEHYHEVRDLVIDAVAKGLTSE